jgi:hypothetical protein
MIHVEIETDNAAFSDDPSEEVSRILKALAFKFRAFDIDLPPERDGALGLMDANGNRVGRYWGDLPVPHDDEDNE